MLVSPHSTRDEAADAPTTRAIFNGIDGETGEYCFPPMSPAEIAHLALSGRMDSATTADLRAWSESRRVRDFGPMEGIDPQNLAETGWGAVFAEGCDPAVREALRPLLDYRRQQAGSRYRELVYQQGERKQDFLARYGAGPGPVDPEKLPYYLLLVGPPREIPFGLQYRLDVQYGVGRLAMDTPEEYARYARAVVAAEQGRTEGRREVTLFGTVHPDDQVTTMSRDSFIGPLAEKLERETARWGVRRMVAEEATRDRLLSLLDGREEPPSVLFTATHGLVFASGHPRQRERQGGILCQDWPGPSRGPIRPEHSLAAGDIPDDADVRGLIFFSFGCYTGGTPDHDEYLHGANGEPVVAAPEPFVARLPQKLLSRGALAVVAHVDRAWVWSFVWPQAGSQITAYTSTLQRLLKGQPIAWAMEHMNQRYAELATDLTAILEEIRYSGLAEPADLADLWTAHNDARSFVVLGNPAVRAVTRGAR